MIALVPLMSSVAAADGCRLSTIAELGRQVLVSHVGAELVGGNRTRRPHQPVASTAKASVSRRETRRAARCWSLISIAMPSPINKDDDREDDAYIRTRTVIY